MTRSRPRLIKTAADDPCTVVLARAHTEGHSTLDIENPPEVILKVGQRLELRFPYRIRETDPGKDEYRHRLESRVGTERQGPVFDVTKDEWGRTDAKHGVLGQDYVFDEAGEHEAGFVASIEHIVTGWRSPEVTFRELREVSGRFRVIVR